MRLHTRIVLLIFAIVTLLSASLSLLSTRVVQAVMEDGIESNATLLSRMLADHIAAAQGGKTDVAALARPGDALAREDFLSVEINPAPARRRLTQAQRRARWGVDLVLVMHLDDLDIVIIAEDTGDLGRQSEGQGDADAHVGGVDDRRLRRRRQ